MWSTTLDGDALRRTQSEMLAHHRHHGEHHGESHVYPANNNGSDTSEDMPAREGTWGERDVGEIDQEAALEEFEDLRNQLSQLQKSRTHETQASRRLRLSASRRPSGVDPEAGLKREDEDEDFELGKFIREGRFEKRTEDGSEKRVGVSYRNLTVKGIGSTTSYVKTIPDAILGTFGPDLFALFSGLFPSLSFSKPPMRTLIRDFTGCVRDGEMMMVLGRPGSGCSTFLKAISNNRESFAAVEGNVTYGGISAKKQKDMYRGEVNYNGEDDIHFATLNVWQTITFALRNKTKKSSRNDVPIIAAALLKMFGISHTQYTLVGDDFVRGVSGGERKRVSIAETLASKSSVMAWDNSTRGLDASTALDYAKSLRIMTDITNRTTLVTLYQAGEEIYELMVLVIDDGREIFSGPANEAKQYFIGLGYECPNRQTTADFLTAVTDPTERRFRPGFENIAPRSPEELETAFRNSTNYQRLLANVEEYEKYWQQTGFKDAKQFEGAVQEGKSGNVSKKSPYTISFTQQVLTCTRRELWLLFGDTTTLWTKVFIVISNGLIVGSIYYNQPLSTEGAFTRGGAVFFSVVFLGWLQLTELIKAVSGRAISARQKDYAFYRPSAVTLARVITDLPVIFAQVVVFGIIMYFLTNLDRDAGKTFIYLLFVFITTINMTALYRMFASMSPEIDTAVRFSGIALNLLIVAIYTGYVIPKTQLLEKYIWFGWLYWINPLAYSFEAVVSNEFAGRTMECGPEQLVPRGSNVQEGFRCGCSLAGAEIGSTQVSGGDYLSTQFGYSRSHLWRNFGVLIAFTILYILITIVATELFSFAPSDGGQYLFRKSRQAKLQTRKAGDEENLDPTPDLSTSPSGNSATLREDEALQELSSSDSIFTWRDVEYTVPYLGGQRKLLNKVNGYAKPGVLVALVGASGAGKTTLLNTLAQRQRVGVISGEMCVDGQSLGSDFQRNTGFCLQGDLHDGTQTIREAIEFSALLRQDASIPRAEKLAYVDKIIDLLDLNDIQNAIISSLGVELRKRLTIGVELAAKPSLLLFLDEPTSGLDSQSAFSIVTFLKKLARAGQAIVCTIHQPSSVLIQQFDMILALNPGGNTFYFGPVGENGKDVVEYFRQRGAHCPPAKNVAEFILETAARPHKREDGTKVDWNEEWKNSEQAQGVIEEIDNLKRTASRPNDSAQKSGHKEYASSTWTQTTELTKRMCRQIPAVLIRVCSIVRFYRDPSYVYGKLFVAVIVGIFNGFTFWQLGYSVQDMQNRMFTCFLIVTIPPTIVAREYPSRIYGWVAFCTANIIVEIPFAIIAGTLYWALWYWPTGLPAQSSVSGYAYLMTILIYVFMSSWGQWICAFAPSFTVISNILPFFFVMFGLFNGVVQPYSLLPAFWRYWLYYLNPATYWIGGMLAATLDGSPVQCEISETARFDPPPGQTCNGYAGEFASSAAGYLLNPNANADCQYCPYRNGNEYLATLHIEAGQKWRDFGIFLAFCISNWFLVYFFIYTVRIRNWSFGFGSLFKVLTDVANAVRNPFRHFSKGKNGVGS
ncbi:ABC-2 type transporter-domain-containing protein [Xylariaceae sp. FL1019]|nr:ABC-2 type transporter-domain-containing protein [Xylariaceae sp. FL1019]